MVLIKTEHHRKYKIIIIITVHVQKKYDLVKTLVVYIGKIQYFMVLKSFSLFLKSNNYFKDFRGSFKMYDYFATNVL